MKKFLLLIVMSVSLLSCGVNTPIITDDSKIDVPFVVEKIENSECYDGYDVYTSNKYTFPLQQFLSWTKPQIIAKRGSFQIGDTIKFVSK